MHRSFALLFVILTVLGVSSSASAHCGTDGGTRAHDPFGSCETSNGDVKCSRDATSVGELFSVMVAPSGAGAQICNEGSAIPVTGRASVYADEDGVMVGVDGDKDMAPSNGWSRVDVGADGCVRARRGSGNGSYYTASGGTSDPDAANERVCA